MISLSRLLSIAIAAVLLCASPVPAAIFRTGGASAPPAGYVGPGDITSFSWWAGLRCYSAAKATGTTKVAKIKRASDNTSTDIVCLTNGQFDTSTASTFCNATTCTVTTLYDQVGTNNLTGSFVLFPTLVFNCLGSYPCMQGHTATTSLISASFVVPTNGTGTQYMVGNTYQYASGGVVGMFYVNGGAVTCICMTHEAGANSWDLSNRGNVFGLAAADAAWHVGIGISGLGTNGADLTIDGSDRTATWPNVSSDTGTIRISFGDSTGVTGMQGEEYGWVDDTEWSHGSSATTTCLVSRNAGTFYGITIGGANC